jgi:hypothetical protein
MRIFLFLVLFLLLFLVVVPAVSGWLFDRRMDKEAQDFVSRTPGDSPQLLTPEMIQNLPLPVQRWLNHSGIVGKPFIQKVFLTQEARMKMKPNQAKWAKANAWQYVDVEILSFFWKVDMKMMGVPVKGRDRLLEGKGEMLIKLGGLVPVVNVADNPKINSGALLRFLGEIVWYPSAALHPAIQWEAIDSLSAKATIRTAGMEESGVFTFNPEGDLVRFSAMRYMGSDESAEKKEWVIETLESGERGGIRMPVKSQATWMLDEGPWTWLELEITHVHYNIFNAMH